MTSWTTAADGARERVEARSPVDGRKKSSTTSAAERTIVSRTIESRHERVVTRHRRRAGAFGRRVLRAVDAAALVIGAGAVGHPSGAVAVLSCDVSERRARR